MSDADAIDRCRELAVEAKAAGNTAVGSVVLLKGQIIGEGAEELPTTLNLTGHAEIVACQNAANRLGTRDLSGSELFSTAEPCIMCSYVIRAARIARVVYLKETPVIGGASSSMPVLIDEQIDAWRPRVVATRVNEG